MSRVSITPISLQPSLFRPVLTGGGLVLLLLASMLPMPYADPGRSEPALPELREAESVVGTPSLIAWTTGAGKWVGYWGRREAVRCPARGSLQSAWGTDIYTDDSSICTAAVHAGLLSSNAGGTVTIEMRPDIGQYAGSYRNDVQTSDWMEPWTGAYVFIRDPSLAEPAIAATSHMQLDSWTGQAGRRLSFSCPAFIELHTVYGTDLYTDDSYVCSAAVHAGVITRRDGGMVTIQLVKGVTSFPSSTRHGVTSQPADRWKGQSYRFVATPPGTPSPPTADTPFSRAPAQGTLPLERGTHL
jgi:LCCL domain